MSISTSKVHPKAADGERDKRMVAVGAGSILLAGLIWLPLSQGAGRLLTLFLLVSLGIPSAVAAAIGLVVLVGGVWGLMKWPGKELVMFAIGLAELVILSRIVHL